MITTHDELIIATCQTCKSPLEIKKANSTEYGIHIVIDACSICVFDSYLNGIKDGVDGKDGYRENPITGLFLN